MKQNIAIIMGGYSSECQISLQSGQVVFKHLNKDRFTPYQIHIFKEKWVYVDTDENEFPVNKHDFSIEVADQKITFDCVFNAIHGSPGEDGYIQAYLELLDIPHTSCGFYQAALTFNKRDLLAVLKPYGIKAAPSFYVNKGDDIDADKIINTVKLPCFVKANRAGSSFGISKVYTKDALIPAIENSFREDDEIIIESFLDGTEVTVGVIKYKGKTTVLPITEIVSDNDFFDYQAKYEGKSKEITPARISKEWADKVSEISIKIYDLLKMDGFTRSEFIFVDNEPYLLEINTVPGFTDASLVPQQAMEAGINLSTLFENAIQEALKKKKYL